MIRYPRFAMAALQFSAALLINASFIEAATPPASVALPTPVVVSSAVPPAPVEPGALSAPSTPSSPVAPVAPVVPVVPVAPPALSAPKLAAEPKPRQEARLDPAITYPDWVLTEDTVWRGEVLIEGALTVAPQATLTIEPGTVVRFRSQGLQPPLLVVQGRIVATGTKDAPILFSSNFSAPAANDWQGVMLLGSEKKNLLERCQIEGAQTGLEALFSSVTLKDVQVVHAVTGMRFQDTLVTMEGGGAADCDTGLSFQQSEATLRNLNIERNSRGISAKGSSLHLVETLIIGNRTGFQADSCRVKVQGGSVQGNGSGVTLTGCEGSVIGAHLMKNREYGLSLATSRIRVNANQITSNGHNGLVVYDGAAAAWDNAIYDNAGYDLYNAGTEEFRAPGNWWGASTPKVFENGGQGRVQYAPMLDAQPSPGQLPVQR
jgi:hypothetical protein